MSDKVYLGQNVSDLDYDEKVSRISRVNLSVDSDHIYTSGDDTGRTLEASCPWGSQAMADSILAKVSGIDYQPYEASDALLDQAAEIGDGITLGGVYSVLAQSSISLDKQCAANISAPYNDEIDDEYPYKTPEQRKSERQLAYARSLITKTTEEIRLEISNELDGLSSSIDLKLDSITSTIQGLNGKISTLEQTDSEIRAEITDQINGLSSSIDMKLGSITTTVQWINGKISTLEQTDEAIRGEITDQINGLSSSIDIKLDGITSSVQGLNGKISTLEQTDSEIRAEITDSVNGLSSSIDAKLDSITLEVTTESGTTSISLLGGGTIDLTGFVTFTGLSGGTTTIDGSCIKTGTIDADRINLTGAISWGDLSSSVQDAINNAGDTVPSYIKSTYIDFSRVSSPKIIGNEIITTGHFAVTGDVGGVAGDLGYMGGANGLDAAGKTTYGVALSNGSPDGLGSGDNYLIVTNGGVRMQAGTHSITVTSNGCYADGSKIGSGAATWG